AANARRAVRFELRSARAVVAVDRVDQPEHAGAREVLEVDASGKLVEDLLRDVADDRKVALDQPIPTLLVLPLPILFPESFRHLFLGLALTGVALFPVPLRPGTHRVRRRVSRVHATQARAAALDSGNPRAPPNRPAGENPPVFTSRTTLRATAPTG